LQHSAPFWAQPNLAALRALSGLFEQVAQFWPAELGDV
jgi:hypothetical protein